MQIVRLMVVIAALATGLSGTARAGFIDGQIDFVGMADFDREGGSFKTIDFLFDPIVLYATEDYAANGVTAGSLVNIIDPIDFSSLVLPIDLWTVGIFTFNLLEVSVNNGTMVGGRGIVSAAGFDDTDGWWSLTTQGSNDGIFSFSATATVPEPSLAGLMGLGLIALFVARRRQRVV